MGILMSESHQELAMASILTQYVSKLRFLDVVRLNF